LEAIRVERGEALGGVPGDPLWGEPIEFDRLVIERPPRTTDISVNNRAIQPKRTAPGLVIDFQPGVGRDAS
jgi:hypothetical protein